MSGTNTVSGICSWFFPRDYEYTRHLTPLSKIILVASGILAAVLYYRSRGKGGDGEPSLQTRELRIIHSKTPYEGEESKRSTTPDSALGGMIYRGRVRPPSPEESNS